MRLYISLILFSTNKYYNFIKIMKENILNKKLFPSYNNYHQSLSKLKKQIITKFITK